jgi:hypothetical protein
MTSVRSRKAGSPEIAEMTRWVAGLGAVTAESLAIHENCSVSSARGKLLAAERLGLLSRWRPLVGEPTLYTATRAGLRAVPVTGLAPARISVSGALHAVACSRAAVELERAYPLCEVIGEPELRRREREHRRPLYSARVGTAAAGRDSLHRPDLVLVGGSPESLPVVVEVELTVKAPWRLAAICRAWARCKHVSGVIYLTAPAVRAPLLRAIERERAGERIMQVAMESLEGGATASSEQAIPGSS